MPAGGRPLLNQRRAGCCGAAAASEAEAGACDHVRLGAGLMSA